MDLCVVNLILVAITIVLIITIVLGHTCVIHTPVHVTSIMKVNQLKFNMKSL